MMILTFCFEERVDASVASWPVWAQADSIGYTPAARSEAVTVRRGARGNEWRERFIRSLTEWARGTPTLLSPTSMTI
jgi:hypothetical protein